MTFRGPFTPSEEDLSQCVRCGLCLQHCPTYVETGLETESPRGRLYLIRALSEGLVEPTPNAISHLDLCLQCRNCEAVCPSGVPYGRIMEHARAEVLNSSDAPLSWRLRSLFLREVIARPDRLRLFAGALRVYRASGLRSVAERLPGVRDRALLAPSISGRPFTESGVVARPQGEVRMRVGFLTGCIMPLAYGRVHRATLRVLARHGCEVIAPPEQACCGALHAHNGDRLAAQALARRNVDAFLAAGVEAIVVNSAGCGSAMKEYGELLADDAEYAEKAARLAALVRDVHEFLVSLPLQPPTGQLDLDVTYQDACHLAHAQRIKDAPREILRAIPGLRLVEMAQPDRCCGSAGVYSLTQPEMSLDLLRAKMDDVQGTGATVIATANPGCMAQLEAGLRLRADARPSGRGRPGKACPERGESRSRRVRHVVELLDRAYRRGLAAG